MLFDIIILDMPHNPQFSELENYLVLSPRHPLFPSTLKGFLGQPGAVKKLHVRGATEQVLLPNTHYLGVSGHRDVDATQQASLETFLIDFLQAWREEYPELALTIISGLAQGVDTVAHRAALVTGTPTVGVLPTPINRAPSRHSFDLIQDILTTPVVGNAVLSEYPPVSSETSYDHQFLARNRIIAWSAAWLLISHFHKSYSGTANTIRHALTAGRPVLAYQSTIPTDIEHQAQQGNGIATVTSSEEMLAHLDQPFYNLIKQAEEDETLANLICTLIAAPDLKSALQTGIQHPLQAQSVLKQLEGYHNGD